MSRNWQPYSKNYRTSCHISYCWECKVILLFSCIFSTNEKWEYHLDPPQISEFDPLRAFSFNFLFQECIHAHVLDCNTYGSFPFNKDRFGKLGRDTSSEFGQGERIEVRDANPKMSGSLDIFVCRCILFSEDASKIPRDDAHSDPHLSLICELFRAKSD